MSPHPHRCFGRTDVSERERRMVFDFRERGPSSPGNVPNDPELARYLAELRQNTDLMKQGASRKFQIWAEKDFNEQKNAAIARRNAGGPARPIRSIQDAHQQSALLSARMAGKPVEGNSIDGTEAGRRGLQQQRRNEVIGRADAEHDADLAEYREAQRLGRPLWNTQWFLRCNWEGRQGLLKVWAEGGVPVPQGLLTQYGLTPAEGGVTFVSTAAPDGAFRRRSATDVGRGTAPAAAPLEGTPVRERLVKLTDDVQRVANALQAQIDARDGRQEYWKRAGQKFLQEYRGIRDSMPGVQTTGDAFEASRLWNRDMNAYVDSAEQRLEYWAQVAIGGQTVDVRTPEELAEQQRQFGLTNGLFDQFVQHYAIANEMLNGDGSPEYKKGLAMQAVTAINNFGSHIFRNYQGVEIPESVKKAYEASSLKTLQTAGRLRSNDEISAMTISCDAAGMRKLLAMRTDLLDRLIAEREDDVRTVTSDDVTALQWHLQSARTEQRYLRKNTTGDEESTRIDALDDDASQTSEHLGTVYEKRTNALVEENAPASAVLDAANKELVFLQTEAPDSPRIEELNNRSDDKPGVIQQVLALQHEPFKQKTDALVESLLTEPAEIRGAMQAVRAEGKFLWKHRGTMTPAMEARANDLVGLQGQLVVNLATEELKRVNREDSVALGQTVTTLVRELKDLDTHAANAEKAGELRTLLTKEALSMRAGVNKTIDAAKTVTDADPRARAATIDQALYAITAEIDALTALSLDPERVANLRAEMSLLDQRIALRVSSEKELQIGTHTLPEIESFRRVFGMLEGEANAIRVAYADDPNIQKEKLDALASRKTDFMKSVDVALKAAVERLGNASSMDDVHRAATLLKASVQMKLGVVDNAASVLTLAEKLSNPSEYTEIKNMYDVIEAARTKALARVEIVTPSLPGAPGSEQLKPRESEGGPRAATIATLKDRPLVVADQRVLDEHINDIAALPTEEILKFLKRLDEYDAKEGDNWGNSFQHRLLTLTAKKDVRLLREYASEWHTCASRGGIPSDLNVDVPTAVNELVAANPEDAYTLREAGLALVMTDRRSEGEILLEKAFTKEDVIAGLSLFAMHDPDGEKMRPYAERLLKLSKKMGDMKMEQSMLQWLEKYPAPTVAPAPSIEPTPAPAPAPVPNEQVRVATIESEGDNPSSMPQIEGEPAEESESSISARLASIDRLLKVGTEQSSMDAVRKFFFLVKDAQVAEHVANEARRNGEEASKPEISLSVLANRFYGSSGQPSMINRIAVSNSDIDRMLREVHTVLIRYAPGAMLTSNEPRVTSENPVMPEVSFDDLDTPQTR